MAKKANSRSPLRASARSREKKASHEDAKTLRGDFSDDLPEGWAHLQLGDFVYIAARIGWRGLKASEYTETGPLFLSVHSLNKGEEVDFKAANHISLERYDESPEIKLEEDDILLAKDGAGIGKIGIVKHLPDAATVNSSLLVVRGRGAFVPKFLFYTLAGPKMQELVQSRITGSATPHLFQKDIKLFDLAVPPLPEQRRIVAKVEELLGRVNAARARLAKVPAILKRFRQSVLAAACSGELTAEWREEHQDIPPACQLLDDIKSDVLSQLDKKRDLARYEEMFERSPPLAPNEGLPENWMLCRVGHIGFVCNGSTPSRKCPEFWRGQISWVSSGEVQNNVIRETRERITKDGFSNSSLRLLPVGTVLIAMIGEGRTRGQSAILDTEATINQNIAAVDLRHGRVTSRYLWHWFRFQYFLTRESGSGSGPQALNCQRVRELPFVLPPLAEQSEIVRRVDALFALADKIEARVAAATARVEKITQAILAKAFRGELVPTEAELARQGGRDYEAASVLLERIRTEREAAGNEKPRRKSPRRKAKKLPKRT